MKGWEGTQAAVGPVCGVAVCGSPGLGLGRVIQKHFCLPDKLWTLVEGTESWGSTGHAPGAGQSQVLQQTQGRWRQRMVSNVTKNLGTLFSFPHSDPKQGRGKMCPNPSH